MIDVNIEKGRYNIYFKKERGIKMEKKIGLKSLIFMNVSALYGIRWISKSTSNSFGLGLGAIPTWFVFALVYFIPGSLICAELAAAFKERDGGLYDWVKEAYGEKQGFLVCWLNWVAKVFWYSSFLTFLAINISYTIGMPGLADNKYFALIFSLIVFWALSIMSTKGISFAQIFTSTGALGSTIPTIVLIIFAFLSVVILKKQPSASVYTVATLTPKLNADSFVAISSIMFGFAGAETLAPFITHIDNPEKNFPKAILISALLVAVLYVVGTISITLLLNPDQITASKGLLDAIGKGASLLGIGSFLLQIIAAGISFSILGCIILYISSPIKMLFGSVEGVFSERLTKTNENDIPANAVYAQAILVTIILVLTNLMPSVDAVYNVLITMTALASLFPYVLLYASYIKLRKERPDLERPYKMVKSDKTAINIARFLLVITLIGLFLTAAPVMETFSENVIYEIEMVGGSIIIIISGLLMWRRREKRLSNN